MDGADGEGNFDAFLAEAFEDAFAHFVLDQILIDELGNLADDCEVDGRIAEARDEADGGRRFGEEAGNDARAGVGFFKEDAFDDFGVVIVADADGDEKGHAAFGQVVVRDDDLGEFGVGNDDQVVGEGADGGGSPADVRDEAFLAGFELDVVAEADLAGEGDVEAGEEVGQGVLQGESDGDTADAEGGEDGGDGDVEGIEEDEDADNGNCQGGEALREGRYGEDGGGGATVELHECASEAGGDGGEGDDPEDEERFANELGGAGGELGGLGGGVDASDDDPKEERPAEGGDSDVVELAGALGGPFFEGPEENAAEDGAESDDEEKDSERDNVDGPV